MSDQAQTVHVRLGERSYDIDIGTGNLVELGAVVAEKCPTWHGVVVTDENVERPHAITAAESLANSGMETDLLVVPAGEASKSIDSAAELWQKCLELGADRKSVIVAAGGGVVGDLAGFIAATFARGLRLVQVPTTLLAQVDSSVGGKTGINLPEAKNIVGAFWQPASVLIDTKVLETLPEREYRAGLAEVVKYGVIMDADFLGLLEENIETLNRRDDEILRRVVQQCCRLKADVVQQDEREETGHRAILNYGHTFCHALESSTGYGQWLHGEAVSIGMMCAARLAQRLGRVDESFVQRQGRLLSALNLPVDLPDIEPDRLIQLMQHDKKTERGQLRFVLPVQWGHVELVDHVDENAVRAALGG